MILKSRENYVLFSIVIILALEAILFCVQNEKINTSIKNEEMKVLKIQNTFENLSVEAKAYSIYDETLNKKIYGKNDSLSLPIASLTKIMTVITAINNHEADDVVIISKDAIGQEGNYGFFVNEKFNIQDLAKFTLIGSANDGAFTLASNIDDFLGKMTEKAQKIGMRNTEFLNFTGLDMDKEKAGAYASAEDVNIMALYALIDYPEVFSASILPEIKIESLSGFTHSIKNTDLILDNIPNLLFSKTGFTPIAGGNLTIIYKNKYGHKIAITVLGSTQDGRFRDVQKIIETLDQVYNFP